MPILLLILLGRKILIFVVLFAESTEIASDQAGSNAKDILNLEGKMDTRRAILKS